MLLDDNPAPVNWIGLGERAWDQVYVPSRKCLESSGWDMSLVFSFPYPSCTPPRPPPLPHTNNCSFIYNINVGIGREKKICFGLHCQITFVTSRKHMFQQSGWTKIEEGNIMAISLQTSFPIFDSRLLPTGGLDLLFTMENHSHPLAKLDCRQ